MNNTLVHKEEDIDDLEPISRVLFCPSMVENGRVSPTAFELNDLKGGPETYVSLFLLNLFQPTEENCAKMHARKEGDVLFGHAVSVINKCKDIVYDRISLSFKKHDKQNVGHIGLHYSNGGKAIKGKCSEPSFIIITRLIALQFKPVPFYSHI
mgnify:CR=1 FL=1|jgi:hypothetical protein